MAVLKSFASSAVHRERRVLPLPIIDNYGSSTYDPRVIIRFIYGDPFSISNPTGFQKLIAEEYLRSIKEFPTSPYGFPDFDQLRVGTLGTIQLKINEDKSIISDLDTYIQRLRGKISPYQLEGIARSKKTLYIAKAHSIIHGGIGAEAMGDILDYARQNDFDLVTAISISPASEKVLENAGFIFCSLIGKQLNQKSWLYIVGDNSSSKEIVFGYRALEDATFTVAYLLWLLQFQTDSVVRTKLKSILERVRNGAVIYDLDTPNLASFLQTLPNKLENEVAAYRVDSKRNRENFRHMNCFDTIPQIGHAEVFFVLPSF